ncbi:MAG: hypothetical protein IKL91_02140 [Bacteroidales bacterium]|nr:hypothetical protein [Bacteroidales bacterium]
MKFSHFIFAAVMGVMTFASCQENITPENPAQEQEVYTVQLGFGGEWDVTYEPLTRGNDNNDLYGIQVYSAPNNEENATWSYYAYGLFDNVDNVTISLLKGFKYKFVATMVVDGKDKIENCDYSYSRPFYIDGSGYGLHPLTNAFKYSVADHMSTIGEGYSALINTDNTFYYRPNTERFYGELIDYIPEESSNDKAKIHMKRTSFGAKFIAQGKLAKAGRLEVLMSEAPAVSIDLTLEKQHDDIYTFSNVKAAYDYQTGNYEEDIDVSINWHYDTEDGEVTVPLGTHKITYKRNATTVVKINLENTNVEGGLGFELAETGAMVDGDEYVINDGGNVDTEIDTNH